MEAFRRRLSQFNIVGNNSMNIRLSKDPIPVPFTNATLEQRCVIAHLVMEILCHTKITDLSVHHLSLHLTDAFLDQSCTPRTLDMIRAELLAQIMDLVHPRLTERRKLLMRLRHLKDHAQSVVETVKLTPEERAYVYAPSSSPYA